MKLYFGGMENYPISFVNENAFENLPRPASLAFNMYCGSCYNIKFWRWVKLNQKFPTEITCYDYNREPLTNLQPANFTDCFNRMVGYYGYNFNISYDGCLSDTCDSEYGVCTDLSGCKPGWQPTQQKCDIACLDGTYGQNCSQDCSNNCYDNTCHAVSGVCLSGCRRGWMGIYCKQPCSKGHFGNNCNHTCDGCISELCNSSDGVCDTKNLCKAGWYGPKCDKECNIGRFGVNCDYHCATCVDRICSKHDGSCKFGCIEGFTGDGCHSLVTPKSADNYTAVYTGVGTFVAIVLVAVIVFATLRYRKMKRQQRRQTYEIVTFANQYSTIVVPNTDDTIPVEEEQPYETVH